MSVGVARLSDPTCRCSWARRRRVSQRPAQHGVTKLQPVLGIREPVFERDHALECLLDDAVAVLRLAIVARQHGFGSLGAKGVIRKAGGRDAASDTTLALHMEHDGDARDGVPGSRMAKLAVACACTLLQWNAHAHQNFFGPKIGFEESLEEVFCRDGALAIRTRP